MSIIFAIGCVALFICYIAGLVKIFKSDNINLVKILLLILSGLFPPFPLFYLFKKVIINEIKEVPERAVEVTANSVRVASKVAVATTEFLLKK